MRWLMWGLAAEFVAFGLWEALLELRADQRRRRRRIGLGWWSAPSAVGMGLMVGGLTTWRETAGQLSLIPFFVALTFINLHIARHAQAPWLQRAARLGPLLLVRHPIRCLREVVDLFGHPRRNGAEFKEWEREFDQ